MNALRQQFLLFRIRVFKDQAAFDELYNEYVASVRRFFVTKLPTTQDADDATVATFWRLWNYLKVSGVKSLSGLIFTIARGVTADFYRTRRTETISLDEVSESAPALVSHEATDQMIVKADAALIRKVLRKLPSDQRSAIVWRYFEDVPVSEIADRLQKTENATRVMLHRSIRTLRDLLSKKRYE